MLIKAPTNESVVQFRENAPGEISLDDFAIAESLYELGASLFENNIDEFESLLEKNFSSTTKKEMLFHISNCSGDITNLSSEKSRHLVIQGILGFAHTITDYFVNESPYPNLKEINTLFSSEIY